VLDDELVEIVENLRIVGADDAEVEAKRAESQLPRSVRDTLSAFANTRGGVLILGLDEAEGFRAVGVRDPAKMAADVASLCSTDMQPELRPAIRIHQLEGVSLVVVEVPEIEQDRKPCFYRGAGMSQGSYIRVHDGDRRLTSYEVQLTLAKHGQPRDDEHALPGAGVEDLDSEAVAALVASASGHEKIRVCGQLSPGVWT
jgi:ATP-dependent DNA helicase RecG